jgi:hypothetical protein
MALAPTAPWRKLTHEGIEHRGEAVKLFLLIMFFWKRRDEAHEVCS